MIFRTYLLGMIISTILCFVSWMLIVFYVNPKTSGIVGITLFLLMLFFFLSGAFILLGFYIKRKYFKSKIGFEQIRTAFRQGVFFSLIFIVMLVLQSFKMLFWWSAILLIIAISLLEFYFMSKD